MSLRRKTPFIPIELPAGGVPASGEVSRNLHGQKLGRKGRVTRDRIIAACQELLADPHGVPLSLSEVARRASLGMTSLYNYFSDLTELLLAVLEPIVGTADESVLSVMRERWADEDLDECCYVFMKAYHDFWSRHARLMHLYNAMADEHDERMLVHRTRAMQPAIELMTAQLDGDVNDPAAPQRQIATVLMIGLQRNVTVATDPDLAGSSRPPDYYLKPAAHMLELAIRDTRATYAATNRD